MAVIDECRTVMFRNFDSMMAYARRGETPPLPERIKMRFDASLVAKKCTDAINEMFICCGAMGIFRSHPLNRAWLDINAGRTHVANNHFKFGRNLGATSLGLVGGAITLGAPPLGIAAGALLGLPVGVVAWSRLLQRRSERPLLWIADVAGTLRAISLAGGSTAELVTTEGQGWGVSLFDFGGRQTFEGYDAWRVLAAALSERNRFGARRDVIKVAVDHIEAAGASQTYLERVARTNGRIGRLPHPFRIALEISLYETSERRALHQDLAKLTIEWRHAEEIAQIADSLLTPESGTRQLSILHVAARLEKQR